MDAGLPPAFFLPDRPLPRFCPGNAGGAINSFAQRVSDRDKKGAAGGGTGRSGVGMEGSGLKSVRFFVTPRKARGRPFRCAREQQDDAQEQTPDNHPNGSEGRTYFRSLCDSAESGL